MGYFRPLTDEMSLSSLLAQASTAYDAGNLDQARKFLAHAVESQPESVQARYNLGVVLRDQGQWTEAQEHFEHALLAEPDNAQILNNLGLIHENQGRCAIALACYRAAYALQPAFAAAEFNLSLLLLRLGHFPEGFARFESRFATGQVKPIDCPHPRWDGDPVAGTLLIHTEQGAGDAMQFVRFVPLARQRVGKVLLVCPKRLMRLFSRVPGIDEIRTAGQFDVTSFDTFCPLLSLPNVLGATLETVPVQRAYLHPPSDSVPLPPAKIASPKLRIGLSWAGSRTHIGDRQRSAKLRDFSPLFEVPGIAFYSLQIDDSSAELAEFDGALTDLKDLQGDWADAASLVSQLDLVIAVDTGIVHLAGALGVPVWIALHHWPDWRWMIDQTDNIWYPSARLFRQEKSGDWAPVVAQMKRELSSIP